MSRRLPHAKAPVFWIGIALVQLRPILMTTLAMLFGMVPLALGMSEGSEQRAPMGQAVIGGVITSPLLTLVVVPVIYTYLDDFTEWARHRWHRVPREQRSGGRAEPVPQFRHEESV